MDREDELRGLIADAHHRAQEALLAETEAWRDELTQICLCKPPTPVTLPDGRTMVYCGPLPKMVDGKARFTD